MMEPRTPERRHELAGFVRSMRERLQPAEFGLPAGIRRRTPGLRREEVAQLCGVSTTWYTWLEQGRDITVSAVALARLARALRLGRAERGYLFELAGQRAPHDDEEREAVPPPVLACVAAMTSPAYILDRTWTARGWNAPAERLFTGWLDGEGDRNLLRFIFLDPAARALISDYEGRARRVVAEFRADVSMRLDDPEIRRVLDELRHRSDHFAQLWDAHGVLGREGGERTFNHPIDGFLRYDQVTFTVADRPDLKLTLLVPPSA